MFIIPFGIPHLPPDSLRVQETAGATEPEHYYELDHYPVPTSSQPGREQHVDEQECDYIDHERRADDSQHQYELDLPPIPTSAANGNSDSNNCDQTESEDTIYYCKCVCACVCVRVRACVCVCAERGRRGEASLLREYHIHSW